MVDIWLVISSRLVRISIKAFWFRGDEDAVILTHRGTSLE
jgi:hypothetical protein